jgi:proline iminopeptidase
VAEPLAVTRPDGVIHGWRYAGDGPRAVLLHGGPCISASYLEPLVPILAGIFEQILYQQRGLAPTTVGAPFTVEANVADAGAVVEQAAGGRAWIVGHSWGGHLALHLLAAMPERISGAVIIDPLGADPGVLAEFGERLQAPMTDEQRARVRQLDAKEEDGTATPEESLESFRIYWPWYFADPASAPPAPDLDMNGSGFAATMASVSEHAEALADALANVPARLPVIFIHGAASPMPVRASTDTAKLISHAAVEIVEGAGHFLWIERPDRVRDAVAGFVAGAS